MNCPACAHANRPKAKFCEECAAPLPRACASCGSELRPSAKFCDECGAAAGAAAPVQRVEPTDARKVVTIVFADLVGSTALHERLDPESARRFMEDYYAAMRGTVESHGGTVTQFLGDGVKAVFGIPRVAEDDAIRAVHAAVAMQTSFRALAETRAGAVGKTGLRVAVNTGEVVASDASEVIGDPVNVAARLQEQGRDGDVVIGETTERLVSSRVTLERLGSFVLKGRTEAVSAYRVTSLERPLAAAAAAFVGRDEELARILSVYHGAIEKPATALAVLVGSPGLGKSRLIEEFARRLGESAALIHARCDAAGGASLAPLAEALRALPDPGAALLGSDAERTRVLDGVRALLAGSPASPEETFFVVRRLLSSLAAARPVVLVIDDVHWAEPLLLDLIEHLVQWGSGVPLLVLVGARPELREVRSTLVTPGGLVSDVVTLAGLDAGAAMRLAANVIGAADLPSAVAAKVLAASEGNPLFVGELVRMLVHEGALRREGERWTAGTSLAALEMPPTIHALLAARIERLRPEERIVLERAAVVGRSFSRSAVAELLSRDVADLDARLEALRRGELIERDGGWFLGEPLLRFHHVLIRDAAYRGILRGTRADLHARFADWIEAQVPGAVEHDETIGWHLEQAHEHLRELGPLDARGRALGERAAQRLAAAGRRALARDDVPLAAGLLGRALVRLDRDDAQRAELALDWCEALLATGDVAHAAAALEELDRFASSDARLRAWHTCFAGQLTVLTAPSGLSDAAESVATASRALAELGDVAGEAKAHFVHAQAFARLGKIAACEAALDRALASARRAGDRRRANTVLAIAPLAALWGPSPVTRASGRCLDVVRVLRITQGAPAVEAVALSCQGVLEALRGRGDAARRMFASARKMLEELGITQRLLESDVFAARIDLLDGDAAAAERRLRVAYEGMRELGLGIDAARAAAMLARALLVLERADEAEQLTRESERLAGDDLQAAIAWRGARAEALARRGEHVDAVALASKAVEIAAATDALLDHADARLALAAALRAAGRNAEADTEESRAAELLEAKGATLLVERRRREGPGAASAEPPTDVRGPATGATRRRVHGNRASDGGPRLEAAIAARDFSAFETLVADPCVVVHHATGATFGRREHLASWRSILRARTVRYRSELLATLDDSLALIRQWISLEGLPDSYTSSFGASDFEEIVLFEADPRGGHSRYEIFAADQLGPALHRLYERRAELSPAGPARERGAATARAFGASLLTPGDPEGFAPVLALDFESVDHRTLRTWSGRGASAFLANVVSLQSVAADVSIAVDDVLALTPDAMLLRRTNTGIDRAGGGRYERPLFALYATDSEGRLARIEWFDTDREAEALERFDALVAGGAPKPPVRRRVKANLATAALARFDAGCAARDVDAVKTIHREDFEEIHRPTASRYGLEAAYASLASLLRSPGGWMMHEPLATLGNALALARRTIGASASGRGRVDSGAWDREEAGVVEVDLQGSLRCFDTFADHHLGDAVARLYERWAELLPEGAERARATTTARCLAVLQGPADLDHWATAMVPDMQQVDHRLLSTWSARDAGEVLGHLRALGDVADGAVRVDDVLVATPDFLLVRQTNGGTDRESGGRYERVFWNLIAFASDGRFARCEFFEADREGDALARFDALALGAAAPPASVPFDNAATRAVRELFERFNARDWAGVEALAAPELVFDERRRLNHNTCGREVWLEQLRVMFELPESRFTTTVVATRDDRLALNLHLFRAEVAGGGGPLEMESHFALHEVDRDGRLVAIVLIDRDDADSAWSELDRRYEALADPAHAASLTVMREFRRAVSSRAWERMLALCSPMVVEEDHRPLAVLGTTRGAEAWAQNFRTLGELAPDSRYRVDHFRASARGFLSAGTWVGTREGGPYEIPLVAVLELDAQDRIVRGDIFDFDQLDLARARFDALGDRRPAARWHLGNAASRAWDRLVSSWNARDWPGLAAPLARDFRLSERRRFVPLELDRRQYVEEYARPFGEMRSARLEAQLLATRGERLALVRAVVRVADDVVGPSEIAHLTVVECNARGEVSAFVRFDVDDVDAAWGELDARFEAGEAAVHPRAVASLLATRRALAARDWDAHAVLFAEDLVCNDHRVLGWGTLHGVAAFQRTQQVLLELAPDTRWRNDHIAATEHGHFQASLRFGTRDGGAYELEVLRVTELDAQGRACRIDIYDPDRVDEALARFAELQPDPLRVPENAAVRWRGPIAELMAKRNTAALRTFASDDFVFDDRKRHSLVRGGVEEWLQAVDFYAKETAAVEELRTLATAGERLALQQVVWHETPGDPSFQIENLRITELDAAGKLRAMVLFDRDQRADANEELFERWAASAPANMPRAHIECVRGLNAHDLVRVRAGLCDDFVLEDHRRTGMGRVEGAENYVASVAAAHELSPDMRMDAVYSAAAERHGRLALVRVSGTNREGGAFESFYFVLTHYRDEKVAGFEFYEPEDLERALARFEELRPGANAR